MARLSDWMEAMAGLGGGGMAGLPPPGSVNVSLQQRLCTESLSMLLISAVKGVQRIGKLIETISFKDEIHGMYPQMRS